MNIFSQKVFIYAILQLTLFFPLSSLKSNAASAYWLDQRTLLRDLITFQLSNTFKLISKKGANTVLIQSDSIPNPILRFIAEKAWKSGKLKSVAWIQKPTINNLRRISKLNGYEAIQVDDHFFKSPPVKLENLKKDFGINKLWCSFQPNQWDPIKAVNCDQSDIQIYRKDCEQTIQAAYALGVIGRRDVAIAAYHSGHAADDQYITCLEANLNKRGNDVFIFKWANSEAWLNHASKAIKRFSKY